MRQYYVYILANRHRTLYIGVTGDLYARVFEHKTRSVRGFTSRYGVDRLVYFDSTTDVREALAAEKRLKGWVRRRKVALIESRNPRWADLAATWYAEESADPSVVPPSG